MHDTSFKFGPFTLHPTQGLSRNGREIPVTPKSLAVLAALAARPDSVVSRDELFREVWPRSIVTDAALSTCIRELRRALQDDARHPRFIQTLHRRGFRLLAGTAPDDDASVAAGHVEGALAHESAPLAGRGPELEALMRCRAGVRGGSMAVVVVRGADGIGKTSLVSHFLETSASGPAWNVCRVASRDGFDCGDACRPLLDLLTDLVQRPRLPETLSILRDRAPTWLAELPVALQDTERTRLQQQTSGTTAARRFRELTDALATIAARVPLIIWLEDLQDFDTATLEWLEVLAREPTAASLMVIVTVAQGGAAVCDETVQRVLESPRGSLIDLQPLDPISARLDTPASPPSTFEDRLAGLDDDQLHTLEAASVAGAQFGVAEVAAACSGTLEVTETTLLRLCRAGLLESRDEQTWPDGTVARVFEFSHRLVRARCYEGIPAARRADLHRKVAHRLQIAWGARAADFASVLAMHFERSGDFTRAVTALYEAGAAARRRNANGIAIRHFQRALALLDSWPAGVERDLWAIDLSAALGREFVATQGLRSEAGNMHYAHALALQADLGTEPRLCRGLWMLWVFHLNCGPLETADALAEKLLRIAHEADDPALLLEAHHAKWVTSLMLGELVSVLDHTRQGIGLCGNRWDGSLAMTTGCTLHDAHLGDHHAAICSGFFSAWADMLRDRREVALRSIDAAIAHARDIEHPFTLAVTLVMSAGVLAAGGDAGAARHRAREGRQLAEAQGFTALQAWGAVYEGWAAARLGDVESGLASMQHGLQQAHAVGMSLFRPFQLALAADAQRAAGHVRDAQVSLAEAFLIAEQVGDRLVTADLHRIRGELELAANPPTEEARRRALVEIEKARELATRHGATLLARRADEVLSRDSTHSSQWIRPIDRRVPRRW
jgi:DNA-binding winged helix-turn-helix (wHTH) protein/tetratricopeptide (TPR) repeat protein